MSKPHVKLDTGRQKDPSVPLKFNYGFGKEEDEDELPVQKTYRAIAENLRLNLNLYNRERRRRVEDRTLDLPQHVDYIQIQFQGQFVVSKFYTQWLQEFGLLGIQFSKFNHQILFAVTDQAKFAGFLEGIRSFVRRELNRDQKLEYPGKIRFVKSFKLYTTRDMIQYMEVGDLMNVKLVSDPPLEQKLFEKVYNSLIEYLDQNGIQYQVGGSSNNLELQGASAEQIETIAKNFDIVLSVTSSLATVIAPTDLNQPVRSYGFNIGNADEELPIIGILDTGISQHTPLAVIVLPDQSFNLTGSSVLEDRTNHGTAIGALAALGKKAYAKNYRGEILADAKLLSIKIMDDRRSYISQKDIVAQLYRAKQQYPGIKIFVLTTCYQAHKEDNEDYSSYAYELDKFAHASDAVVFICTANNDEACNDNTRYDLKYFFKEPTNICVPAESMNNITVGAAARSLMDGIFQGVSTSGEFPTLYSRKGHLHLEQLFSSKKINRNYFKPDVIDCGGDYEFGPRNQYMAAGTWASMELLSSNPAESFYRMVGTSYSTPLVANIGAQIQKLYPSLKAQSIKTLIINGASLQMIRFPQVVETLINKTAGHGITDELKTVFSDDNAITFVVEDEIEPEQLRIFPIHFPEYLSRDDLGKVNGILRVTATLCFSFEPVLNYQLAYCPIHMAFSFYRNQSGAQIQVTEKKIKSKLKSTLGWSQNGRHVSTPIPYSNSQKISFTVNRRDLLNEDSVFKLGVQCRINPQLVGGTENKYKHAHPFSMAITFEETLNEQFVTGQLYDEMSACNSIENITAAELDAEGNLEV
jgi:hypothetical protein